MLPHTYLVTLYCTTLLWRSVKQISSTFTICFRFPHQSMQQTHMMHSLGPGHLAAQGMHPSMRTNQMMEQQQQQQVQQQQQLIRQHPIRVRTHTHTPPNALCQGWTINRNRNSEPLTNVLFPHRLFRFFNPVNTFPLKMYYRQCSRYIIVIKVKCLINRILGFWFRFFNFDFRLYRPALHCGILYISHNAYISVIRL